VNDVDLEYELRLAKHGMARITEAYRHSWEASAAHIALSAIGRLEAIICEAMDELNKENP
jgi:hypothetical protein